MVAKPIGQAREFDCIMQGISRRESSGHRRLIDYG
jgi:hypothetical protein